MFFQAIGCLVKHSADRQFTIRFTKRTSLFQHIGEEELQRGLGVLLFVAGTLLGVPRSIAVVQGLNFGDKGGVALLFCDGFGLFRCRLGPIRADRLPSANHDSRQQGSGN